ncbi:MAG TPA: glycine--tRNA ligase [Pyrinomonadaceae bacterium]|nr:glycine--tRNA ligase [Pyrinomonadaceae bacterium]HMP66097.1 glycine--tRNA ligase [Pyrinomonadaceae bacterium]
MSAPNIETIVSLSKRRGFVFPASEIYGGLGSSWDYGPLGVELVNNIKNSWWRRLVYERDDIEGIDSSIIQNRLVWKYSGHEDTFSDPLVDCRECKSRLRQDKLEQDAEGKFVCSNCGSTNLTDPKDFNLMFRTTVGAASTDDDPAALAYLRPETAQGIFTNFANVLNTSRRKLPFGIAQIGKAFRNEVTPGNFIFRTREFEQMELEYFVKPDEAAAAHQEWIDGFDEWLRSLGISSANLKHYEQSNAELAHYAERTVDILYRFFPEREDEDKQWDELMGIANRTDFDLRVHSKKPEDADGKRLNPDSTEDLSYFDTATNERFYPYIIEPSVGVNRTLLAVMMDAYTEKTNEKGETRVILKLTPEMAPIKVAVLPLAKNKPEIVEMAKRLKRDLQPSMRAVYDDTGGIGKLYARQDEIGTPFCVTVDHESLEDKAVTVRNRDTWEQERIQTDNLKAYLEERLSS